MKKPAQTCGGLCKALHEKASKQDISLYISTSYKYLSLGTGSAKGVPVEIISIVSTLRKNSWISQSMF
jgi:hypothetical protein